MHLIPKSDFVVAFDGRKVINTAISFIGYIHYTLLFFVPLGTLLIHPNINRASRLTGGYVARAQELCTTHRFENEAHFSRLQRPLHVDLFWPYLFPGLI